DGEQPPDRFRECRDIRPEEAGPETDRVEPPADAGDGSALPDHAEFEEAVRNHDAADDDPEDEKREIGIHRTFEMIAHTKKLVSGGGHTRHFTAPAERAAQARGLRRGGRTSGGGEQVDARRAPLPDGRSEALLRP